MTEKTTRELELEATYKLAKFFKENNFTKEQRDTFLKAFTEAAVIAARETAKALD